MRQWIGNLKLRYKILLSMVCITTLSLFTICIFSYHFLYQRNQNEALQKAEDSVRMLTSTLDSQFNSIALNTADTLVSPPFSDIITDISYGKASPYLNYFSSADRALNTLRRSNNLISTAMIYGSNGTFFDETILGLSRTPSTLLSENIWDYSKITVLPVRNNTMLQRGKTLPILFPVTSLGYGQNAMIYYTDLPNYARARFILLLDAEELETYFERFSTISTHAIYLADESGMPLSVEVSAYPEVFSEKLISFVSSHDNVSGISLNVDGSPYYLHQQSLNFCGLKLVHLIQKSTLFEELKPIRLFMLEIWASSILLAIALSLLMSNWLTKPLARLKEIIAQINLNAYHQKTHFEFHDEAGILGEQLNSMYDTIQLQMEKIKDEEQKKARAEIQMLSEQINPHFLYNTLECIHFQILNQHTQVAGAMLESLGQYLRITLSSGDSMIPFSKEIAHVKAYMQIMNRHSSSGIRFSCTIDPELEQHMILKMLLQPLAENSIKHGFSQDILTNSLTPPEISIQISLVNQQYIHIEVVDNGKGIDIEKAKSCLTNHAPHGKRHFGLNNVYKRLQASYGTSCSIIFTSIPYFRNCVIIDIPYFSENTPK